MEQLKKFLALALISAAGVYAQSIDWNADSIAIRTEEQLRRLVTLVNSGNLESENKTIILINDIDLKNGQWKPLNFSGTFDGNNKVIRGVNINGYYDVVGFFERVNETAIIKNLGLVVSVKNEFHETSGGFLRSLARLANVFESDMTGGLAGYNSGTIDNCYVFGSVFENTDHGFPYVGGLVGENYGRIINCYAAANVDGRDDVGGLVGKNYGGIINCYAAANVKGKENVGGLVGDNCGLVGENYGGIINCYAVANVKGRENVGGLVGDNWISGGSITNCYTISKVEGGNGKFAGTNCGNGKIINSYALEGTNAANDLFVDKNSGEISSSGLKTAAQMKQQSTYNDWDFENVWAIKPDKNNGFPYFIPKEERSKK